MIWEKRESRNKEIGLRLGRLMYHIIYHGRPFEDYPRLVYLSMANGADCGDINHSVKFIENFLPHLAEAVRRRLKKMFTTRMVSTGCLPPVNIFADKATHQRNTRQLIGGITLNPGGEDLLVSVLFGLPLCPKGDGPYLCSNIKSTVNEFITDEQKVAFTGDGVYDNTKVADIMSRRIGQGRRLVFTWDYMHKVNCIIL